MRHKLLRGCFAVVVCIVIAISAIPPVHAGEETVNILLIGLDRRPGLSGCRSDAMVLCSYRPDTGTLTMVSFLRDLYVSIPGHGKDRLNAAYALGGRQLLCAALKENFDVDIDGCVEVDFNQFSEIIDALGGVRITLREDEARRIEEYCPGSGLTQGQQLLNGQQALCYSRIRDLDPDGDFSRTRRQRAVLQGILRTWKDAELSSMLVTIRKLLPMISTDLSPVQLLDWIFTAAPARSSLRTRSLQIPGQGTCRDETIRGMAVIICDFEENRRLLEESLEGG